MNKNNNINKIINQMINIINNSSSKKVAINRMCKLKIGTKNVSKSIAIDIYEKYSDVYLQ